jgi:diguanylate cyclase (GGDEF)-like protein
MDPADRLMHTAHAAVLIAAVAAVGSAVMPDGIAPGWAAAGCGVCVLTGVVALGQGAWSALLPAGALLGGGWPALGGWCVAAIISRHLLLDTRPDDQDRLRKARDDLRDVEREHRLLQHHLRRYPVLIEASLELCAAREPDQFAESLGRRTRELLPETRDVRVFLGRGDTQECRVALDQSGSFSPPVAAGLDEAYVAAQGRPLVRRNGNDLRALIPLRGDDHQEPARANSPLRGVLAVRLTLRDPGDRLVLEVLEALGRLGSLGLAAVDVMSQARTLALHDELTGLFGQHEFLRRLDEQAAACRRRGLELGVVMCDLDQLKGFNDRFGHAAGDAALRAVAAVMRQMLPAPALVCRYGGEEFGALLPGATPEEMSTLTETLRAAVAETRPDAARPERWVTASIGWTMLRPNEAPRAALARADAACYQAKADGRNRVAEATP